MMPLLECIETVCGHNDKVWDIKWNPTGNLLASCGTDKTIRIWGKEGNQWVCKAMLEDGHQRTIRKLGWSPCGNLLASASFDATVCVWSKRSGQFESSATLEGHENEVKAASWSVSGSFLATCSRDKSVWIWEVDEDDDFECAGVLSIHTQDVKDVAWHPNEDVLASASYDNTIKLIKESDGEWFSYATLTGHTSTVWSLCWDRDGRRLVSGSDDKTIRIWQRFDMNNREGIPTPKGEPAWKCVCTLSGYFDRPIYCVSWCHHTGLIAAAAGDNSVAIFQEDNPVSKDVSNTFSLLARTKHAHEQDVNAVAWNPTSRGMLATCSDDGEIKLWQLEDCDELLKSLQVTTE